LKHFVFCSNSSVAGKLSNSVNIIFQKNDFFDAAHSCFSDANLGIVPKIKILVCAFTNYGMNESILNFKVLYFLSKLIQSDFFHNLLFLQK
jgi:hypothetical protein